MEVAVDIDANAVENIAKKIARCDFCVTVSRYVTGPDYPWHIDVSESGWLRRLCVVSITANGEDAELDLLPSEQFGQSDKVRLRLSELVADRYPGVKKILAPMRPFPKNAGGGGRNHDRMYH